MREREQWFQHPLVKDRSTEAAVLGAATVAVTAYAINREARARGISPARVVLERLVFGAVVIPVLLLLGMLFNVGGHSPIWEAFGYDAEAIHAQEVCDRLNEALADMPAAEAAERRTWDSYKETCP